MKPIFALLGVIAAIAPHASALPIASHTLQGEVVAVEREHKRFTVRTVKTPAGFPISWGPRTRFVEGGKLITADALKRGQKITVRYRAPFAGPRIAERVFLHSDGGY